MMNEYTILAHVMKSNKRFSNYIRVFPIIIIREQAEVPKVYMCSLDLARITTMR